MSTRRNRPAPRHCDAPSCRSFRSPTYTVFNPCTCLTIVYDNSDQKFAYYSQRRDILAPHSAPKPLLFVPEIAAKKGYEPSSENAGEIRLNHIYYEGGGPAKKSRRGLKIGPSKLRNEVLPEDLQDEVVLSSPPAKEEEIVLPLREASSTTITSQETSGAADATTTSASSTTEGEAD